MTTQVETKERPIIGQTTDLHQQLKDAQGDACRAIFAMFQARERYIRNKTAETHGAWLAAQTTKEQACARVEAIRARIEAHKLRYQQGIDAGLGDNHEKR